jgi:hypothetical protein
MKRDDIQVGEFVFLERTGERLLVQAVTEDAVEALAVVREEEIRVQPSQLIARLGGRR